MKKILFLAVALVALALSVSSALAGAAPTITSTAVTTAKVGQQYTYTVTATDPEGSAITYSLSGEPTGMSIDSTTGKITWTPTVAGSYPLTAIATDNESLTDTQSFTIDVSEDKGVFNIPTLKLGDDNQNRKESVTQDFTISNTGTKTITNIAYSLSNVAPEYNATVILSKTVLAPGDSLTMTINLYVPESQDSGLSTIGAITLSGTDADAVTSQIELEAESLIDVEVILDGTLSGRETLSDGEDVDVEPFESFTLTVEFENLIDEDDDVSMDFDIRVDSNDIDEIDGERESVNNVDGDEKDDVEFSFTLDPDEYDVDDEPFDLKIMITGTDENGAVHSEVIDVELNLDVERDDLRIRDARLSTSNIYCGDRSLRVDLTLYNVGTRDVDEGMYSIEIPEMDIKEWVRDIEIDQDENDDFSTLIQLPEDPREGTYYIDVTAYGTDDTDDDTDTATLQFVVNSCSTSDDDDSGDTDNTENTESTGSTNGGTTIITTNTSAVQVSGTPVSSGAGSSFFEGSGYLIALGVLVVILLVAVIVLLVRVTK